MKIAVVVGHQEKSPGAINKDFGVSEFAFNRILAHDIELNFAKYNKSDECGVVYRETTFKELPDQLNELGMDLIVSLHANAFNGEAFGCEMLYYHKSEKGKKVAQILQDKLLTLFQSNDRGIKPRTTEDRGGYLLRYTKAPCVICEPFFIDENEDYRDAQKHFDSGELTKAYCEAINEAVKYLREA